MPLSTLDPKTALIVIDLQQGMHSAATAFRLCSSMLPAWRRGERSNRAQR
jgi:hypothetical protein